MKNKRKRNAKNRQAKAKTQQTKDGLRKNRENEMEGQKSKKEFSTRQEIIFGLITLKHIILGL